jgi:hypothetical protein
MRAGDNAADAAWRGFDRLSGNEMQPRLILANGSRAASATSRIDDVAHSPSFMAMDAARGSGSAARQTPPTNPSQSRQLNLFPEAPRQLELNLNLGNNPVEYIANYNYVSGPNPNKLIANRVSGKPTNSEGVYIKLHDGKVKTGMAGGKDPFNRRYNVTAPEGGASIEIEILQTRYTPPQGLSSEDTTYWNPKRQRRFDEEYIDRTIPQDLRYRAENAKSPVSQKLWDEKRHIFGYHDIPSNFGR